jgi:cupin 2 domain-containing protein
MNINKKNIFGELPHSENEIFEDIISNNKFRLERIISRGQTTPQGEWYDQDKDECVILLTGAAKIQFYGEPELIDLSPGDYIIIPAHKKHRVEWTDENTETIWLALHY